MNSKFVFLDWLTGDLYGLEEDEWLLVGNIGLHHKNESKPLWTSFSKLNKSLKPFHSIVKVKF